MGKKLTDAVRSVVPVAPEGLDRTVADWRDRYTTRIETEMTKAFPLLEKTLLETVNDNMWLLLRGGEAKFLKEKLQPKVEHWVTRVVSPVLDDAGRELETILTRNEFLAPPDFDVSTARTLFLPLVTTVAGGGVIFATFNAAITSGTVAFFFATMTVAWPLLIAGTALGVVLVATGVANLALIKSRIRGVFSKRYVPELKRRILGEMCAQLQRVIEDAATKVLITPPDAASRAENSL